MLVAIASGEKKAEPDQPRSGPRCCSPLNIQGVGKLGEQLRDYFASVGDLHRSAVSAGECRFQRDTQRLTDRRHDVLRCERFRFDSRSVSVGGSDSNPALETRATQYDAPGSCPVIATCIAVDPWCPAELTHPNDGRIL